MKIGIMSMQRVCNYGSFLQAYGLKKVIESLGHEVVFVDYKPKKPVIACGKDRILVEKKRIAKVLLHIFTDLRITDIFFPKSVRHSLKMNRLYQHACKTLLGFGRQRHYKTKVDVLVIGSDEVFNCLQLNPSTGFTPELFGIGNNANKIVTYAASFGNTTLERLTECGKDKEIGRYLKSFDCLSVRDHNSLTIVEQLAGVSPNYNLDPVLIHDFSGDVNCSCALKDFVIVYAYKGRLLAEEKRIIREYANKHQKRIVAIGGYQDFADENFVGYPLDVLDYFSKADFIFTDTFHGTIFSIISKKRFVTFVRHSRNGFYGNAEKVIDLLAKLGLSERMFDSSLNTCFDALDTPINYELVDGVLAEERANAIGYLRKCFKNE